MSTLHSMTVRQLRDFCKTNRVQGYSRYVNSKGALVDYIQTWLMQPMRKQGLQASARPATTAPCVIEPKVHLEYRQQAASQYFTSTTANRYVNSLGDTERQALNNLQDAGRVVVQAVREAVRVVTHLLTDDREPVRTSKPHVSVGAYSQPAPVGTFVKLNRKGL